MQTTLRHSIGTRQYRAVRLTIVIGAVALGVLLVDRITVMLAETIANFYGTSLGMFGGIQGTADGSVALSFGLIVAGVLSLLGSVGFVAGERLQQRRIEKSTGRSAERALRNAQISRLSSRDWFDTYVLRTLLISLTLMLIWILEVSYVQMLAGEWWGIQYSGIESILPLATVFGTCTLVSLFIAAISMFGLRTVTILQAVIARLSLRKTVTRLVLNSPRRPQRLTFSNEWFTSHMFSRPPPLGQVLPA